MHNKWRTEFHYPHHLLFKILSIPDCSGTHYVGQTGLQLAAIFLLRHPEFWDYRHNLPIPVLLFIYISKNDLNHNLDNLTLNYGYQQNCQWEHFRSIFLPQSKNFQKQTHFFLSFWLNVSSNLIFQTLCYDLRKFL